MIEQLVRALYAALAAGDRGGVEVLLAPDFTAEFSAGYGPPIGGRHHGSGVIENGWWAIGRRYAVAAEAEEWIPAADGRLLVLGHYRGYERHHPEGRFQAAFAHLWSARADKMTALIQITDTALWPAEPKVGRTASN